MYNISYKKSETDKLIAFMGPELSTMSKKKTNSDICESYIKYFTKYSVKCVIRCNEPKYNAEM